MRGELRLGEIEAVAEYVGVDDVERLILGLQRVRQYLTEISNA